jgi:hypothetical protein
MSNGAFTWENFRRKDGTLDVLAALIDRSPPYPNPARVRRACQFIDELEELMPLRNAEAASIALAHALQLVRGE